MADSFNCRYKLALDSTQFWDDGQGTTRDGFKVGTSNVPAAEAHLSHDGSGATLADRHYRRIVSLAAAATLELDLLALTDENGNSFGFSAIKLIYVAIRTPTANKTLEIDPAEASSDGWAFSDAAVAIGDQYLQTQRLNGITVDSGQQNLHLENIGSEALVADLLLVGVEV